jgi:hypothetical protein
VLVLFLLKLLLEMRMTKHIIFTETIDFIVRVIGNFETIIEEDLLCLDLLGDFLIYKLFDLLFSTFGNVGLIEFDL